MPEMAKQTVKNLIRKVSGEPYRQGVIIVDGRIVYKDSVNEARHI